MAEALIVLEFNFKLSMTVKNLDDTDSQQAKEQDN